VGSHQTLHVFVLEQLMNAGEGSEGRHRQLTTGNGGNDRMNRMTGV
jgi:hypothetical protein